MLGKCYFTIVLLQLMHLFFTFVKMQRIIVIFFLVTYLFSSTEFSELLKIPVLIEHYGEHQEMSKGISFSEFLYMHYGSHNHDKTKNDKDDDLPFQSHSDCGSVNFVSPIILPTTTYSLSISKPIENSTEKNYYDVHASFTSSFLCSIWQPPQIA